MPLPSPHPRPNPNPNPNPDPDPNPNPDPDPDPDQVRRRTIALAITDAMDQKGAMEEEARYLVITPAPEGGHGGGGALPGDRLYCGDTYRGVMDQGEAMDVRVHALRPPPPHPATSP